jgi:hypothetical protein
VLEGEGEWIELSAPAHTYSNKVISFRSCLVSIAKFRHVKLF